MNGPVAVVSGANRGIGLEVCRQLAQHGHRVILGSREQAKGERAASELSGAGLEVLPLQLDVGDPASVKRLCDAVSERFGRVDVLVKHGRIVNVSSEAGSISEMGGGTPAYSVSKAALNALTRVLAAELRPERILVNAVCPGWTATDMGGRGGRAVAEGAASVVWAALLDDDGPSGGFFRDGRTVPW